jgi:hypothetical protein
MLYTTPDRTRYFLIPDDADVPEGALTLRSFVGRERPGRARSVDEAVAVAFEVSEDEARTWVKGELGDVLGDVRERVLGFAERMKGRTADLREENRATWPDVADDPELRDAATRIRDGLKDVGRALQRLAKEAREQSRTEGGQPPEEET